MLIASLGPAPKNHRAKGRVLSPNWCQTPCGALAHFLSLGLGGEVAAGFPVVQMWKLRLTEVWRLAKITPGGSGKAGI